MFYLSHCTYIYQTRVTILPCDILNDFLLIGIININITIFRFLKQIKRNIAEEKELMKYYPGWKVGTYFGDPIYKIVPEDQFIEPNHIEYFIHASPKDFEAKRMLKLTS